MKPGTAFLFALIVGLLLSTACPTTSAPRGDASAASSPSNSAAPQASLVTPSATSVGFVTVGSNPESVAVDSRTGDAFVYNLGTNSISVLAPTNHSVVSNISLGPAQSGASGSPNALVYVPANDDFYAADWTSSSVHVISGATLKVTKSISVGANPQGIAYDSGNGDLYVANSGSKNISVIAVSNGSVVATVTIGGGLGSNPDDVAYDPANAEIYATNADGTVNRIADSNNTLQGGLTLGVSLWADAYDPVDQAVYITGLVSVNGGSQVTGQVWEMVGPSLVASTGAIYSPYAAWFDPVHQTLDVTSDSAIYGLNGSGTAVVSTIPIPGGGVAGSGPMGMAYDLTDEVIYVAVAATGSVGLIPTIPLLVGRLVASPPVVRVGSSTRFSLTVAGGVTPYHYNFTNLPPGCPNTDSSSWSCAPTSAGNFSVNVTVRDLAAEVGTAMVTLTVLPVSTYSVLVSESGLPAFGNWTVMLDATTQSSQQPNMTFSDLVNGSYNFTARAAGFLASPSNGSVVVAGSNTPLGIGFSVIPPATFAVTFHAIGLASGTSWTARFNGVLRAGIGDLSFGDVANGSYAYTVTGASGYTVRPASGSLAVEGRSTVLNVTFTPVSSPAAGPPTLYYALGAAGAVAAGAVAAALWVRRTPRPAPPTAPLEPPN